MEEEIMSGRENGDDELERKEIREKISGIE